MTKNDSWKLRPKMPAKPKQPAGAAGTAKPSSSGKDKTTGLSGGEKVDMVFKGIQTVGGVINTIIEENRKNRAMLYAHEEELKKLDVAIKHEEEETKRIIASSLAELERYRIDADARKTEIMANLEMGRLSHEKEMELIRNRHRERMRMIDICEKAMFAATSLYDKYRQPAFMGALTENIFEQMNSALMMLSENLSRLNQDDGHPAIGSIASGGED